ncbi:MAG: spore germination protein [Bacillota bacterium]|nr:spore germination protein [Bacillota bacterium]
MLFRLLRRLAGGSRKRKGIPKGGQPPFHPGPVTEEELARLPLPASLEQSVSLIQGLLGHAADLIVREVLLPSTPPARAAILFIEHLVDKDDLQQHILKPLLLEVAATARVAALAGRNLLTRLVETALSDRKAIPAANALQATEGLLDGDTLLLLDGSPQGLILTSRGGEGRAVEEPDTESVVRGPREGFTERLHTNLSLLRRKIKSPNLRTESLRLGRVTRTQVVLAYIEGLANRRIVEEVRRRLQRIEIDGVLESAYVEEFIEDSPFSPFPQVAATERPDRVAAGLLEGRVAILVDGSPFALTVPAVASEFFLSSEDYYARVPIVILVRFVRFVSFFVALLAPAVYVALTTYHQEMLPTPLAMAIAAGREGVPFPAVVEALLMVFTFEVLREAGVRMPRPLGQAISIVGALVIGETAVQAGLATPLMLIVIAITAIASFAFPSPSMVMATRLLAFPMVLLAAMLGIFGIIWGLLAILIHLVQLRSFGIPYLWPYAPLSLPDLRDSLSRLHWWWMRERPSLMTPENAERVPPGQRPWPPRPHRGQKKRGEERP